MQLVLVECPQCGHAEETPFSTLTEGSAANWMCSACLRRYDIVVLFEEEK